MKILDFLKSLKHSLTQVFMVVTGQFPRVIFRDGVPTWEYSDGSKIPVMIGSARDHARTWAIPTLALSGLADITAAETNTGWVIANQNCYLRELWSFVDDDAEAATDEAMQLIVDFTTDGAAFTVVVTGAAAVGAAAWLQFEPVEEVISTAVRIPRGAAIRVRAVTTGTIAAAGFPGFLVQLGLDPV